MTSVFDQTELRFPKPNYDYITNEDDARKAMNFLANYPIHSIDTETTALDMYEAKISLIQIGVNDKVFVFDVRHETEHSSLHKDVLKPILTSNKHTRILQNASFDMKMIYRHMGFYLSNIYDTMLVEQLLNLGLPGVKVNLPALLLRYLGISMQKEPRLTFQDYNQKFQNFQLEYAANDVVALETIKDLQWSKVQQEGLENVCRLEFEFLVPMAEMEGNGILLDVDRWSSIMVEVKKEMIETGNAVKSILEENQDQSTLFGVSTINIDSNLQLKKALNRYGLNMDNTGVDTLKKHQGVPVIDALLDYRGAQKLISTYSDTLIEKINPHTGRLHTDFKQLVATGRMSSSRPNLQNIPHAQKFRSCFVAKEGYSLVTSDMASCELRILGNLSEDPVFLDCFKNNIDLHTRTASEIFDVHIDKVTHDMRNAAKGINFGLCYGISPIGLARGLKISKKEAKRMIDKYFKRYSGIEKYLEKAGKSAILNRHTTTISGRKRYYSLPEYDHPDRKKIQRSIERRGKNASIQGSLVFDTNIKGLGNIGKYVNKEVELETGFGRNTAIGVYSGEKDVYELKLSNGAELNITLEHQIPVCTNSGMVDKRVEDIVLNNDMLIIPLGVENGKETDLSGYKYIKGHWRETYKKYPYPNKMDSKLAFIIGCLIGDGSYSRHDNFRFVCPSIQRELFDKFNSCVYSLFKYKPKTSYAHKNDSNRKPLPRSVVHSVAIRGFLKHIGLNYVIHRNKSIPEYFFIETIENKGALLNGLFSTDGGFTKSSGPNFTTTSEKLAHGVHQLLFSLGINSNLKTYENDNGAVYRLQVPRRFNKKFKKYISFSVDKKTDMLNIYSVPPKAGDHSLAPDFIPKTIEKVFRRDSEIYNNLSFNDKAHLRRFKLGECSYTSWRKFYNLMPDGEDKKYLSQFLYYDFCKAISLKNVGKKKTYDLVCEKAPKYFIANGVIVHNSNADTIKESMILLVDRIIKGGYDAKLLLTVHDEVIVEVKEDQKYEVGEIVSQCLVDGFGRYFSLIPMEADSLIGPCWLKGSCENKVNGIECGNTEMKFVSGGEYGTKLICNKCGAGQE
jgi:DNA polymerase I-like protein with 3'-5' exonuclease and polymerase domains